MDFFGILLAFHIACGAVALLTFLIPMVAKKGGRVHNTAGWIYVCAMGGVAFSTFGLAAHRWFLQPEATDAQKSFSVFLAMVAVFAASAVWSGLRVLRFKSRKTPHTDLFDRGMVVARIATAVAVCIYGAIESNALLAFFPVLPILSGVKDWKYWSNPTDHRMHWWFHHMESMFTACIATVTAFVVTALPRLFDTSSVGIWLWFVPAAVMVPILKAMLRHFRQKFSVVRKFA